MRDTVTGVDDNTGEGAVGDFRGGPRGGNGEYRLYGYVHSGAVEGLEHDFGGVLAVFGRIEGLYRLSADERRKDEEGGPVL